MTITRLTRPWLVPIALALSCAPARSAPPDPMAAASAAGAGPVAAASAAGPGPVAAASAASSGPVAAASAATPDPAPAWRVERDQPISQALAAWAARAGWVLQWEPSEDWLAPQATVFHGEFVAAAKALVEVLADEGANVRATFYQGNKTLLIRAGGSHE